MEVCEVIQKNLLLKKYIGICFMILIIMDTATFHQDGKCGGKKQSGVEK